MTDMSQVTSEQTPRRLPSGLQHVIVFAALMAALSLPLLVSPVDAEAYMFWPVTGFAIATLLHRPTLFPSVALALWLWGVLGPLGGLIGTLNLLTLAGPLIYFRVQSNRAVAPSIPARRLGSLALIILYALAPSALIGTLLLALSDVTMDSLIAGFLVYLLSDFAGVVIFLPVVTHWLTREHSIQWQYLGFMLLIVLLPPLLVVTGLSAYARISLFIVLPYLLWLAQTVNRATLSHALLILFLGHLTMAYFGMGGYDPLNDLASLASLALLLIAVFITIDTLQAMREDRDHALEQAEWLAKHDNRSPALNERGLLDWAETLSDLSRYSGVIYKPVNSGIFQSALNWQQIGTIETRLIGLLAASLPGARIAKVSDMTLVALLPKDRPDTLNLRDLLKLQMTVDDTRFTLDGAVACLTTLSDNMGDNLARLNALWHDAVNQPNERLKVETNGLSIQAKQNQISLFQQYRSAVEQDGLELWLQPIRSLNSAHTDKAEVLARLNCSGHIISPGQFLPVFQDFNYLTEFDRRVLTYTFRHFKALHASLPVNACINVNISGATLSDQNLLAWLEANLGIYQVAAEHLCLEITETELVHDKALAVRNIQGFRTLGFNVAIDDFGTGLASFEYLNQFAVNVLKLDGQFISDVAQNPRHQAIVRSMVAVAASYNLELVGEFVDSEEALQCLHDLGVDYAQGYHVGKPTPDWRDQG